MFVAHDLLQSRGKLKMLVRGLQIVTKMVCSIVKVTHTQLEFYYFHSKDLLQAQKQCRILTTYKKSCIFKDHTPDKKKKVDTDYSGISSVLSDSK